MYYFFLDRLAIAASPAVAINVSTTTPAGSDGAGVAVGGLAFSVGAGPARTSICWLVELDCMPIATVSVTL